MALDPITAVINVADLILGRVLPDKVAKDAASSEVIKMQVSGELQQILGQIEVNKVEAASTSIFVAGWRPYIGWILGSALAYGLVFQPFIVLFLVVCHSTFDPARLPTLDSKTILELLGAMLGFGVMRTIDKSQGTDNGH